ncbi:hypothetical protein [Clostridium estertheticum]|uniref:hypothetical protein n=1 Tax=Clostridium estertheticum TaxID=238834 RepID=UPI001CF4FA40|nr:hypothetical protein [Clostridium estertheticum]MCB2356900.1 hypothetical protein [Clostridium estertheticum]WAG44020.1 hypothetical protein LL065_25960 [Clostridium estertheticum]
MDKCKFFENEVSNFLNLEFKNYNLNFMIKGDSNNYENDIIIIKNNNSIEFIETNSLPCQSTQIIVFPIDKSVEFIISEKSIYNPFSEQIIKYMNENLSKINKKSITGIELHLDKSILFSWIKYHYHTNENSEYIIAGNLDNFKLFIPLDEINSFFDVNCTYRKKRSGTTYLPQKYDYLFFSKFLPYIKNQNIIFLKKHRLKVKETQKNKLYIEVSSKINKKDLYLKFDAFTSFLSYKGESNNIHTYEVKKRNTTIDPSIVFSFKLSNKLQNQFGFQKFKNYILNLQ